jgi:hypothetical protein
MPDNIPLLGLLDCPTKRVGVYLKFNSARQLKADSVPLNVALAEVAV